MHTIRRSHNKLEIGYFSQPAEDSSRDWVVIATCPRRMISAAMEIVSYLNGGAALTDATYCDLDFPITD